LRFFEKDLRIKLTAILLVFIIVATGAALVISYTLITRIIRNNVEGSMGDSARLTSNVVEVGLERRTTRIALLASFPDIRSPATPSDVTLATLTLFTRAWPIGLDAVFVDTNGNVVAGTGKLSTIANATRTSWFDNAQSGGISLTYIYNKAELTNAFFATPVLVASSPVRDINNQIFGYVIAFTNVSDITKAVEGVMIETTGHGFVVSGTGVVVAGHVFPPKAKPSSKDGQALSDLVTRMTGGHSGSESVGYAGKGYLVSWTPVEQPEGVASPGLDWTVGVAVPTAEAYAPANDVAMALLLLSVVLLVVGVFAAFFLGRSITETRWARSPPPSSGCATTCEVRSRRQASPPTRCLLSLTNSPPAPRTCSRTPRTSSSPLWSWRRTWSRRRRRSARSSSSTRACPTT
jgi:hypothetical protein